MSAFPRLILTILCAAYLGSVGGLWFGDGPPPGVMLPAVLAICGGCVSFLTWALLKSANER